MTINQGPSPKFHDDPDILEAYLGYDYAWGGGDENGHTWGGHKGGPSYYGFDCSGLVVYAYAQIGMHLPHYSGNDNGWGQFTEGKAVSGPLLPADLVFFEGASDPQHVAIYVGKGLVIEAPQTGEKVKLTPLTDKSPMVGARRLIFP